MRDDLGGLPTRGGGVTRHGAVVRGDALDELTEAGWQALVAQSVRTIGDGGAQTAFVLDRIDAALAAAGARMDQVVQTRMYITQVSRAEEIGRAHEEPFGEHPPASAMVAVAARGDRARGRGARSLPDPASRNRATTRPHRATPGGPGLISFIAAVHKRGRRHQPRSDPSDAQA